MIFKIVTAFEADVKAISDLEKESFSSPWSEEDILKEIRRTDAVVLAARDETDTAVGYVSMRYVLDEGYIGNIAVRGDCRRRGIATELLRELESRAKALKLAFVTLEVRESNAAAIKAYESAGFSPAGRRRSFYTDPREDALIYTKYI